MNYIEGKIFKHMLEIDIARNSSQFIHLKKIGGGGVGVLKSNCSGFRYPNDG